MKDSRHDAARTSRWQPHWWVLVFGLAASYAFGMFFAALLQVYGIWHDGAQWERATMLRMQLHLPLWLDTAILGLPWFGTNITLIPFTLAGVILLLKRYRRFDEATRLAVVQVGAYVLNPSLKFLYDRPRPDVLPRRGWYGWAAYPSGHAITGIAVLFTYAIVVHHITGKTWPFTLVSVLAALSLVSRVYLGVHWPTDIIGGALIGAIWLLVTIYGFRRRQVVTAAA